MTQRKNFSKIPSEISELKTAIREGHNLFTTISMAGMEFICNENIVTTFSITDRKFAFYDVIKQKFKFKLDKSVLESYFNKGEFSFDTFTKSNRIDELTTALSIASVLGDEKKIHKLLKLCLENLGHKGFMREALLRKTMRERLFYYAAINYETRLLLPLILYLSYGGHENLVCNFMSILKEVWGSEHSWYIFKEKYLKLFFLDSINRAFDGRHYFLVLQIAKKFPKYVNPDDIFNMLNRDNRDNRDKREVAYGLYFCSQSHIITEKHKETLIKKHDISTSCLSEEVFFEQLYYKILDVAYYLQCLWPIHITVIQHVILDYLGCEARFIRELLAFIPDQLNSEYSKISSLKENKSAIDAIIATSAELKGCKSLAVAVTKEEFNSIIRDERIKNIKKTWTSGLNPFIELKKVIMQKKLPPQALEKCALIGKMWLLIERYIDRGCKPKAEAMMQLLDEFEWLDLKNKEDIAKFKDLVTKKSGTEFKNFKYGILGKIPAFFKQLDSDDETLTDSQLLCREILKFLTPVDEVAQTKLDLLMEELNYHNPHF